jgi:nucleotide-binding universal stress UspA family protein
VAGDDWRVEVELNDQEHGFSLGERLRSVDLDDDARERLGRRVIVTRDGSKLFLYTTTEAEANEAARVVQELAAADRLTAEIRTTQWHPVEEAWKDPSVPLPRSDEDRERELESREADQDATGDHDWYVHVHAPDRAAADELERRLRDRDFSVERRWRYLTIGAASEEQIEGIAATIREVLPQAKVEVEPTRDVPATFFVRLGSFG